MGGWVSGWVNRDAGRHASSICTLSPLKYTGGLIKPPPTNTRPQEEDVRTCMGMGSLPNCWSCVVSV